MVLKQRWNELATGSNICALFFRSLSSAFSVQGIPAVIVVDESGEILTKDGRSEVLNLGVSAFVVIFFLYEALSNSYSIVYSKFKLINWTQATKEKMIQILSLFTYKYKISTIIFQNLT